MLALSPVNIFSENFEVVYQSDQTGLSIIEQMYTARGSQGLAILELNAVELLVKADDLYDLFLM